MEIVLEKYKDSAYRTLLAWRNVCPSEEESPHLQRDLVFTRFECMTVEAVSTWFHEALVDHYKRDMWEDAFLLSACFNSLDINPGAYEEKIAYELFKRGRASMDREWKMEQHNIKTKKGWLKWDYLKA